MPPVIAAFAATGALWGGLVGVGAIVSTVAGAVIVGGIAGALIGYAFEELLMPDMPDSPTYKSGQPVYTIEEGKPIAKCYGRCKIAGNVIRSNDPNDDNFKIIIGHGHGEIDSLLSWKINSIEWDSLIDVRWYEVDYARSVHYKNTALGTDSQTPIQINGTDLFSLEACGYRGIAHTGFKLTKNSQIGSFGSVSVEGRFSLCEPIGGGAKVFSRNPAVVMWDFYRNIEGYEIADLDINAFTSLETLCDFCPSTGEGGPIRPPGPNSTTVKATSFENPAQDSHGRMWCPFYAFDVNKAVEGAQEYCEWAAEKGQTAAQRLNVDLGFPIKLKKVVIVNSHGAALTQGIQHFSIQGSNTAADLDHTAYLDGASGWTDVQLNLTATQYDSNDPYKDYEVVIPKPAYRYYSIKILTNCGDEDWMKVRDICFWGRSPRYTFDYNFDSKININDAKKLIWSSFDGRVIRSQGKLKPVWDWLTMADGSGGLTAKTSQYSFTMDNIVKDSFVRLPAKRSNKVKVEYLDSSEGYKKIPITEKDDSDIDERGEVTLDVKAYYITQRDIATRKCKRLFYRAVYSGDQCKLTGFPSSQKLEVYDLVQVTHTIPGWTAKEFVILSKAEDEYGRPVFLLRPYYTGIFDDVETPISGGHSSISPSAWDIPPASTGISVALVGGPGSEYDYRSVKVSFTPPAEYLFYAYTEIYASRDDITYYLVGTSSGEDFVINGMGTLYYPGDTCYIKLKNVSTEGVTEPTPVDADASVVISSTIRSANFYLGLNDIWGGNAAIDHADTKIVLGNLDGTPKIALGASADLLSISNMATYPGFFADGQGYFRGGGENKYIQWNGEITIKAGADFLIDSANQKMTLGSGNNLIALDAADASYRLAIGHATYGSAPFRVTKAGAVTAISGVIGGWALTATTLYSANICLDQANDKIIVNTITIDGAENRIRSDNYVSGYMGAGFNLEPDLLEVGNIACRGIFRTNIFQKDTISVVGGNVLVMAGDVLAVDMVASDEFILNRISEAGDTRISEAGDTRVSEGSALLTIEGNETFAVGDILRIKTGEPGVLGDDEWLEVVNIAHAPMYHVIRDKGGDYAANSNPAWTKGAAVVNYGQSGDGGVYMTASESNAPYISIFTHAGSPWNTITTHVRMGNLNGYAGYGSDIYGWAAYIDADNYIKIDPTNGIRMSGNIVITSGSGIAALSDAGILATIDDLDGVPDGVSYGKVQQTILDSGYLYLMRRSADATEQMLITAGGIEGYVNNVKNFELASGIAYLGDQANEHIKLSSSGLQIKKGATLYATYGSTTTLGLTTNEHIRLTNSVIQFKDGATVLTVISGGMILVGQIGAGQSNVYITSGAIQLRNDTTAKITLASDGNISLAGGITMSSAGIIKGGQTDYATGTGFFLGYSGGAYKFSFGDATNYIKWDGVNLLLSDGLVTRPALPLFIPGTHLEISSDVTVSTTDTSDVKKKEIYIVRKGILRIKFNLWSGGGGRVYGQIWKNGVAVGTQRSTLSTTAETYTENIANCEPDDLLQLYLRASSGVTAYARYFRFYSTQPIVSVVIL